MSSIARPPDPCLVAVVLIVRSRAGPRFVFHYPPAPSASSATGPSSSSSSSSSSSGRRGKNASGAARGSESAPSSDADLDPDPASSSDDDDALHHHHHHQANVNPPDKGAAGVASPSPQLSPSGGPLLTPRKTTAGGGTATPGPDTVPGTPTPGGADSGSGNASRERRTESGHGQQAGAGGGGGGGVGPSASSSPPSEPPWDTFLGLKTDVWEKLLCPTRPWHKRRFEVGVNDLAFVGWPVFVKGNGSWRRRTRKREEKEKEKKGRGLKEREEQDGGKEEDNQEAEGAQDDAVSPGAPEEGNLHDGGAPQVEEEDDDDDDDDDDEDSKEEMSMFNLVFVLNPSILEYHVRVKEKYDNVIKKFGKGLKSEQSRADYVWSEAQKMLQIKENAREDGLSLSTLYSALLSKSSLAQAISTVYSSISNSRIASVALAPQTTMSLQVPPLTSTSSLPSITEPSYPGLWLTTADSLSATDETSSMAPSGPSKVLAKHFALLLLSDEATILKDIEATMGSVGSPLVHYIRYSKPNKSFAQISAQSQIPLSDIQLLANHLIYWRRARAIPPLSQRDTYIVSPNAEMSKLGPAAAAYEAAFPTLPSLPKMLSALSGTPRPYSSFIPSRDHKQIYLDILAWLMRGGWVTQLRTFGWVKADVHVKRAVAEAMATGEEEPYTSGNGNKTNGESPQAENNKIEEKEEDVDDVSSSIGSEASGEITPIPGRPLTTHHRRHSQENNNHHGVPTTSSLIPQPQRASPLEARWLDEIFARFPEPQPRRHDSFEQGMAGAGGEYDEHAEHLRSAAAAAVDDDSLQKHWAAFVKYFNGTDALEKIAVREGLKRKLVWRILARIDASSGGGAAAKGGLGQGAAGPVDAREKVLLTVRHW